MSVRAIVRPPGASYGLHALTRAAVRQPVDLQRAREQHARYVAALSSLGVQVTVLEPDERFPDSTFMQDTAVILDKTILLCYFGAPSRRGEEQALAQVVDNSTYQMDSIRPPAMLEGGDVLVTEDRLFVGLSTRTNAEAVTQLQQWADLPVTAVAVPPEYLHLVTGCSTLGHGRLLATAEMAALPAFADLEALVVPPDEAWASNALAVGEHVLVAGGYPRTAEMLARAGFNPVLVPISEFQKRDGSVTCLTLLADRFASSSNS